MHELLVAPVAWGSPWWGWVSAGNQLRVLSRALKKEKYHSHQSGLVTCKMNTLF